MIVAALFFYLFAGLCVASAFMVIASRNPVHSVLYLILAFVNAAGLFVMMGAEFLAMILIVVYVGAIPHVIASPIPTTIPNTEAIGLVLYTKYVYFFEAAGMILLVAMVGAIVLTLQHRVRVKRQSIVEQVSRTPAMSIEIRHVRSGQGLGGSA
jgi:NADH-quinone oxidoreductase subunit J